jgi:cytochrome c553
MNRLLAALAATGLLCATQAAAQSAAQPDLARGESIAKQVCAACHSPDGNSAIPANPKLAGQFQEYLHKQLVNFKAQGGTKAEHA